ncbi:MAG: PD-(D/E)XK nuclease family protein [Edaphobacter sp.]
MDGVELLPVEIAEALERGSVVVTGNQRTARVLRRGFDRRQHELGRTSWQPAAVLAWDAWMAALSRGLVIEGHATELLLNRTQEHAVWRLILEADQEMASLQSVDSLAEMAAEAWKLLSSYEGLRRLRGAGGGTDTRAFQRWARTFERTCKAEGFLSSAQLEETLCGAVERGLVTLPANGVVLAGFDRLTPAQIRLVEMLRSAGVAVEELRPAVGVARRMLVATGDELKELSAAARWVRGFLEQRPEARVAVIVPGLEIERREIDRVFREVLAPELEDICAADSAGPYEFSLGVALTETAMAAIALDLLRWAADALPLERVSGLLLSPEFAMTSEEQCKRAEFDAFELRRARMLRPEITVDVLIGLVERSKRRNELSRLLAALRAMRALAGRIRSAGARTNAEWAETMRELLEAAGWGSEARESSIRFQTRRKWESVLDELATLDFDGQRVEYVQAVESAERIARQTTFAPESHGAPVQVMGPLEAAGGTFDAVWFLRAGELSWPMETRSNGLLPWALQRDLEMPGTDVARDSEDARRMTARIADCAATVVFSYAQEKDDVRQRCSSALSGLGLEEIGVRELAGDRVEREVVAIEEIEDVARVQRLPDGAIHGGARILELQAACGFRAFAEARLRATELEQIEPGMDARESGTVVHDVLKYFWDAVKTQDELRAMPAEERDELLGWCINEALKRTERASETAWDAAYVEVQRGRLRRLVSWWLELEMDRRIPFEVRLSEKEFKNVQVGPLHLNVRMDRIDEVDGGEMLIDYKTGAASPNDWLTERPDAPQLPLYAVLSDAERLKGVAFGLVRAGEGRGLKGYAVREGLLPGKLAKMKEAASFEGQVERWREILAALAEEFYVGDARVHPKNYPKTCERCAQRVLCRLDAATLEEDEEDEAAMAEEIDRG